MADPLPRSLSLVSRYFPLRLIMGALITVLLLSLGLGIIFYTFENEKKVALASTEKLFDLSSRQTEEKLLSTISTVESFVAISATLKSLGVENREKMATLLPYCRQSFVSIPWMFSVYIGYENGDFYMIQALRNSKLARDALSAPEQAAYAVKQITHGENGQVAEGYVFYGANLEILAERRVEFDGYDPRKRGWYTDAREKKGIVVTQPYVFFATRQIGISIASRLADGDGVVGADSTLEELADLLQGQKLTPHSEIALVDRGGKIILSSNAEVLRLQYATRQEQEQSELGVEGAGVSVLQVLYDQIRAHGEGYAVVAADDRQWFGHVRPLLGNKNRELFLLTASPMDELMVDARAIRQKNMFILALVMVVAIAVGLIFARRMSGSLQQLSQQAEGIRDFRLTDPLTVVSSIREVHDLATGMTIMQSAINRFVEIARALSAEKKMEQVLEMIVAEAQAITGADGGGIGLVSDDGKSFVHVLVRNQVTGVHLGGMSKKEAGDDPLMLRGKEAPQAIEALVIASARSFAAADVSVFPEIDWSRIIRLHTRTDSPGQGGSDYACRSLLLIPLLNRHGEVIGVLHLVNARDSESGEITPFSEHKSSYVQALSSNAALALDNNRLFRAQKELFDSFVRLLAGAIDTKSPYTGGHCQRVPVIAGMLADAASRDKTAPFADFALSEDEQYELYVASWLHDCGKVTTPEYVVDKATKLETIYNRIHEIRTRFEVLWRDAEIAYRDALALQPSEAESLHQQLVLRQQQLREDFAFVAACNQGGEFMAPEQVERLQAIGSQTWERYFDNRLGLSGDEQQRLELTEGLILPVTETLLADRKEHIIRRPRGVDPAQPYGKNPWGFNMAMPHDAYNQGELYNLAVARGTLTVEERFKINDHIVQTIIMLNRLPFPKEIRRVPDWAGNHHETLDGTGYPRGLRARDLSIPERIMAVADIFEALTAADRPYKQPKLLSDCLQLMSRMRDDGHICPDLFALLLRSGIYKEYARRYMRPEQIDEVDITRYLEESKKRFFET